MRQSRLLAGTGLLIALLLIAPGVSRASPILSGTFDLGGTFSVTGFSLVHWTTNSGIANEATIGTNQTGSFTALSGGSLVSITDLKNPPETVDGPGFSPMLFITFLTEPTWPTFQIDFIPQAPTLNPSNNCQSGSAMTGQTCTLAGSPFTLSNVSGIGGHVASQAGFVFDGMTSDGKSLWSGNFTAQFNVPYQTLLGQLFPSPGVFGTVTNTYSATFTAQAVTVPEPGFLPLFLVGAVFVLLGKMRRQTR